MDLNSRSNSDFDLPALAAYPHRQMIALTIPSTDMMLNGLRNKLKQNFKFVSVDHVMCPDLRMFGFTAPGLGGDTMILEVGNRNKLFPKPQLQKRYAFTDIIWQLNREDNPNFVIGAGKHSCPPLYDIAEFYANVNFMPLSFTINGASRIWNKSCAMWWNEEKGITEFTEGIDPVCSMHGNFFMSNGYPELVYRIEVADRIGSRDYLTCIHDALICVYPTQPIGLGGVFMGLTDMTYHITPSYSTSSLNTSKDVQKWLKYYVLCSMYDRCIATGIMLNSFKDSYLFKILNLHDITNQHFHSITYNKTGGHIYPSDNNPKVANVHYIGYFSFAESLQLWDFRHFFDVHQKPAPSFIYPVL